MFLLVQIEHKPFTEEMCWRKLYAIKTLKYVFLLLLAGNFYVGFSQSNFKPKAGAKIEILNANSLEYDESTGKKAKKLIGNVQLKHDDALMFCDSAYIFSETNTLNAYSNVKITQGDSLQLFGDSLSYDGNTKKAILRGNIRLINKDIILTTQFLDYDRVTNVAYYFDGGKMISRKEQDTLTSQKGYYHSESQAVFFKENVVLKNPQYTILSDTLKYQSQTETVFFLGPTTIKSNQNLIYTENGWYNTTTNISEFYGNSYLYSENRFIYGDSIYYNRELGVGKITCNAIINDTTAKLEIHGDDVIMYEKKDSAIITKEALLMQFMDNDTLFMHADTFKIYTSYQKTILKDSLALNQDSTTTDTIRNLLAYHNAKFFKSDMQGKSDSIVYNFADSTVNFYTEPIIWSNENQLTAEFIYLLLSNKEIHSIYLKEKAFIISKADSLLPNFNQIKGENMVGYFLEKKLHKIEVNKQAETIFFAKDDAEKYIGVNKASGNNMLIFLAENTLKSITFIKDPEGIFYPIKEPSPKDLILKGFNWDESKKPMDKFGVFY